MIRWCAYCQSYQGERPPYDDYSVTHTLCDLCMSRGAHRDEALLRARVEPIAAFYRELWARSAEASAPADELLDRGLALGLAPFDLLVGILQPALYEVGDRWARQEASVEDEHRLTALCLAILERLEARHPELAELRDAPRPDVLLATVGGNEHRVGLHIVEFFLVTHGIRVKTAPAAASLDELVRMTRGAEPRVLGIGVTLPSQLPAAASLANRVVSEAVGEPPIVRIGGSAMRHVTLPEGTSAEICDDFRELAALATTPVSGLASASPSPG